LPVHRSLRASVIAPILAGALAATAIAFAGSAGVHGNVTTREAPKRLRITGNVANLRPGETRTYTITVSNPLLAGVVVHRVHTKVRRGEGPAGRCPAKWLHIRRWRGVRRIGAVSSRPIHLTVRLRRAAPTRCLGARWPIHYVARSVRR
jgi:hypothetical protein